MSLRLLSLRLLALGLALACWPAPPARAVTVPSQFVVENAWSGQSFTVPTCVAFLPDGRALVGEKQGTVWMVVNGVKRPTPVWDNQNQVLDNNDRGFLSIAVDPNYFVNHRVYFLYTVDPDSDGVDANLYGFGRLVRFTMNTTGDTNVVNLASRAVLVGVDWPHGPTQLSNSHSIGSLRWGRDGSLMFTAGEGASFDYVDEGGHQPAGVGPGMTSTYDDIGAFRAQDITIMNGKVFRINPENGFGYASNPYTSGDIRATRAKVWAYGLRNPFRFVIRPGTGSVDTTAGNPGQIVLGDVGWNTWEEMNVVTAPGQNFGWPCVEGPQSDPGPGYATATPAHNGCGSVGSGTNPAPYRAPAAYWNHGNPNLSVPPGYVGAAAVGGIFYTSTSYPASYRGRYFFGDYADGWIQVATFDSYGNLLAISPFGENMDAPVDFAMGPDSNVYYVSITTGQVRRIRYTGSTGGNTPPVASAIASVTSGVMPLSVNFNGSGSFDPDGNTITYAWTFGDGGTSTSANPSHVYQTSGPFTAILTVDDGHGGQSQATVNVNVGTNSAFPTTPVRDNFNRANGAIGSPWAGDLAALSVNSNKLRITGNGATAVWMGQSFGADQECYITFSTYDSTAPENALMLKAQGPGFAYGFLGVNYDAVRHRIHVNSFDPNVGFQDWAYIDNVTFAAGDRFGARAFGNGLLEIYKNATPIAQVSVVGFAYHANSGYIGWMPTDLSATTWDDFGGGNWTFTNSAPSVTVTSPTGSESWTGGTTHNITWNATDDVGVTSIDVAYREDDTSPWTPLAVGITNSGTFPWAVHNTPTPHARVRVVAHDASNAAGSDSSHAWFNIVQTPGGRVPTTLRDFFQAGTQPLNAGSISTSSSCLTCHAGYNAAVEPGHNWKGSMMGQAARDPLFYACLAVAEQDAPSSGDMCLRCHSPMAWLSGKSQPTSGANLDATTRDGVTCDFCHRMVDPNYKPGVNPVEDATILAGMLPAHRPTTYGNGQYVVDSDPRKRGPFSDAAAPHSFLTSSFHTRSEMCGTCHDVSNPVFNRVSGAKYAAGPLDAPADSISPNTLMPLERTLSEWKASLFPFGVNSPAFAGNAPGGVVSSCQDCHMRQVTGPGCNIPGSPTRTNLPLHDFTGGNAWMPGVVASLYTSEVDTIALAATSARATYMLQNAASLQLSSAAAGDSFRATVRITNNTGHKLPTGYPEGRRMWVHLVAKDDGGNVVFESGAYDGSTGTLASDAYAQVYEAELGLSPGFASALTLPSGPSFHFALNDTIYKDNRIPPLGFSNASFDVFGGKPVDSSRPSPRYADGQNYDDTSYPLPPTARNVTAEVWYQTASKEYVEFLQTENSTNTAGNTLMTAWSTRGKSTPVRMLADSLRLVTTSVGPGGAPLAFALTAVGNPFHGKAALRLTMPRADDVTLDVVDVTGRLVRRVSYGHLAAGQHALAWDGRDASGREANAGLYWAVVHAGRDRLVRDLVRLR